MNLLTIISLMFFLHSSCGGLEINIITEDSSPLDITSSFIQKDSENPYWNVYEPRSNIAHNKFIIFPKQWDLRTSIKAIFFFLNDPFKMIILYDLPHFSSIFALLKENLTDLNFINSLSSFPSHTYKILNKEDFLDYQVIHSLNEEKKITRYTLCLEILREFHKIFPLFPLDIFDQIPFLQQYHRLKDDIVYSLNSGVSPSTISNISLNYLGKELRVSALTEQEFLTDIMQELYVSIHKDFLSSPSPHPRPAVDIFRSFNKEIENSLLPDFSLIRWLSTQIEYFFYSKNGGENFPDLMKNLLEAAQEEKDPRVGARNFLSQFLSSHPAFQNLLAPLQFIDISSTTIANLFQTIISLQEQVQKPNK